mmetsp:Transcript_74292/g.187186  ORF Transcript_74292/g.187186 Transcript_74292/m.187186 type:complete len:227 (-) Transcript_74292:244-924(-)
MVHNPSSPGRLVAFEENADNPFRNLWILFRVVLVMFSIRLDFRPYREARSLNETVISRLQCWHIRVIFPCLVHKHWDSDGLTSAEHRAIWFACDGDGRSWAQRVPHRTSSEAKKRPKRLCAMVQRHMDRHGTSSGVAPQDDSSRIAQRLHLGSNDVSDPLGLCLPLLDADEVIVTLHLWRFVVVIRQVVIPEVLPVLIEGAVGEDVLDACRAANPVSLGLLLHETG